MGTLRQSCIAAALFSLAMAGSAWAQTGASEAPTVEFEPEVGQSGKDVVWVPTPQALVDRMLDMAGLTAQDTLVDLGSGDGRTVITAAKRGATARGIEYNPDMVALSKSAALREGVADRVVFEQADIFESEFSEATVVTLFLLPHLNLKLKPTLLEMAPGTRVVSNSFTMGEWEPDDTATVGKAEGCTNYCTAYKWVVPPQVEGNWKTPDGELVLTQTYQLIEGSLRRGNATESIAEGRLDGSTIRFKVGDNEYQAEVSGQAMQGKANGQDWSASRAG